VPSKIRDPERLKKGRERIVLAAIDLFDSKGFHETSVDEIAASCGFTVGAIYKYVRSKHDILYLVSDYENDAAANVFLRWTNPDIEPVAALIGAVRAYVRLTDSRHKIIRINYRYNYVLDQHARTGLFALEDELRHVLLSIMERAATREMAADPDMLVTLADNTLLLGQMWCINHRLYSTNFDLEAFIDVQLRILLSSLGVENSEAHLRMMSELEPVLEPDGGTP
jgi:AcrR family transcriptional regulator